MKVNNLKKVSMSSDEETAISSDSGVLADRLILGAGETAADKVRKSGHFIGCHPTVGVRGEQPL